MEQLPPPSPPPPVARRSKSTKLTSMIKDGTIIIPTSLLHSQTQRHHQQQLKPSTRRKRLRGDADDDDREAAASALSDCIAAVAVLPSIKALIATVAGLAKPGGAVSLQFISEHWGVDRQVCLVSTGLRRKEKNERSGGSGGCAQHHETVVDVDAEVSDDWTAATQQVPAAGVTTNHNHAQEIGPYTKVRSSRVLLSAAAAVSHNVPHSAEFTCAAVYRDDDDDDDDGGDSDDADDDHHHVDEGCDGSAFTLIDDIINTMHWIEKTSNGMLADGRFIQSAATIAKPCTCGILQFSSGSCIPRRVVLCQRHWRQNWEQCFSVASLYRQPAVADFAAASVATRGERSLWPRGRGGSGRQAAVHRGGGGGPFRRHPCLAQTLISSGAAPPPATSGGIISHQHHCTHQYGLCAVHEEVPEMMFSGSLRDEKIDDRWCRIDHRNDVSPVKGRRRVVEAFVSATLLLDVLTRLDAVDRGGGGGATTGGGGHSSLPVRLYVTERSLVLDIAPQSRPTGGNGGEDGERDFGFLRQSEYQLPRLSLPTQHAYRQMEGGTVSCASDNTQFGEVEADCSTHIALLRDELVHGSGGPVQRGCSTWLPLFSDGTKPEDFYLASHASLDSNFELKPTFTFRVDLSDAINLLHAVDTAFNLQTTIHDFAGSGEVTMCIDVNPHSGLLSLVCVVNRKMTQRIQLLDWGPMVLDRHHGDIELFKAFEEDALRYPSKYSARVPSEWICDENNILKVIDFLAPFRALLNASGNGGGGVELFMTVAPFSSELLWTVRIPSVSLNSTMLIPVFN